MKRIASTSRGQTPCRTLTINRIASARLRADKKGYAALALGIMLSIFFITSMCLFISGVSLANEARIHAQVGSQDAFLLDSDITDAELLQQGYFTDRIGHIRVTARADAANVYIGSYDQTAAAMLQRKFVSGRMPEAAGEIAIEQGAVEQLRLAAGIGDTVTLPVLPVDGIKTERTYTIVGILEEQSIYLDVTKNVNMPGVILNFPAILMSEQEPAFDTGRTAMHRLLMLAPGVTRNETLRAASVFSSYQFGIGGYGVMLPDGSWQAWYFGEQESGGFTQLLNELGMSLRIGENALVSFMMTAFMGCALVLATIVGIAGAMEGTLSRRTETIGMLRAVGATQRQIRRIFGRESWLLALLTAPVSVALSCLFVWGVSRVVPQSLVFRAEPFLLIPVLLLTILVVLCSSGIPLRRASRVSPMSVMRDTALMRKQKRVRSRKNFRVSRLMANRQLTLHPTRQVGSAVLIGLMVTVIVLAAGMGTSMLDAQFNPEEQAEFTLLPRKYSRSMSFATEDALSTLSAGDMAQLRALPLVDQVESVRSSKINLLFEGVPDYFAPECLVDPTNSQRFLSTGLTYLGEPTEQIMQTFYEFEVQKHDAIRSFLETDQNVVQMEFLVVTPNLLTDLEDVTSGRIDLNALNEGREVLVYAPDIYWYKRSDFGYFSTYTERTDSEYIMHIKSDYFVPGMPLSLNHLSYTAEQFDREIQYAEMDRVDFSATVGAVLGGKPLASGILDAAIITTEQGAMALGLHTAAIDWVDIHLTDMPDAKGEETLARRIRQIAMRGDLQMQNAVANSRERMQDMRMMTVVLLGVALILYAVAVGMVSGNMTRRIRADVRLIGTLRAVGADERVLRSCYTGPLWFTLLLGAGIGAVMTLLLFLARMMGSVVQERLFWLLSLGGVGIFLLGTAVVCWFIAGVRIKETTRHSIVENIREL